MCVYSNKKFALYLELFEIKMRHTAWVQLEKTYVK